jgi:hypothetical protein
MPDWMLQHQIDLQNTRTTNQPRMSCSSIHQSDSADWVHSNKGGL